MVEFSQKVITVPISSTGVDGNECTTVNSEETLVEKIIACVAYSSAVFKSQQINEPELTIEEKKKIASELLHKSHSQFLSRFGKYLDIESLEYFTRSDDNYEVIHYVNKLKRYFNSKTRKLDRKNRRYEALKNLVEEGDYFSETSMMKRNPLLYQNLVGQYLTEKQKKDRDNVDNTNISYVNFLMENIGRDQMEKLRKDQEDEEEQAAEENDSDSDTETEVCTKSENEDDNNIFWGETSELVTSYGSEEKKKLTNSPMNNITTKEQIMLRQEFVTQMYQSFLDGKDTDFDYSIVDDNEAYDNIALRTQDEEEQYFDSEVPEWVDEPQSKTEQDESEDELDIYMKCLQEQTHTNQHLSESPT